MVLDNENLTNLANNMYGVFNKVFVVNLLCAGFAAYGQGPHHKLCKDWTSERCLDLNLWEERSLNLSFEKRDTLTLTFGKVSKEIAFSPLVFFFLYFLRGGGGGGGGLTRSWSSNLTLFYIKSHFL